MASAVEASGSGQKTKGGRFLWGKRILLILLILLLGLPLLGFAYQTIATQIDKNKFPAPGKLVDVGGYRLHLYCTGNQRGIVLP